MSCCCNYLDGWFMEMVGSECAGIVYTQGFRELLHREHHGECQERHGDGDHVMVVEWVWDFVMDGEATSGAVAASMVYGKIMRVWSWHEPGEGSESDDLADVQSMGGVVSYLFSSTVFTNM